MRILGISGSLRAGSLNRELLRLTAEELPEGVELVVYDGLAQVPPYDQDLDDLQPDEVERLKAEIAAADAVLVATPEFNGSIPGQLKNAFDWVSRPLAENPIRSKPVAVIGASTSSFGGIWAQRELKKVLGIMGARVLDVELAVPKAHGRLDEPDSELRAQLREVGGALVDAASRTGGDPPPTGLGRWPEPGVRDSPGARDDAPCRLRPGERRQADHRRRGLVAHRARAGALRDRDPDPRPWDQANQRHVMRLELLDADGQAVEVETDDGMQPVVFFDDVPFEVGRPAGLKPGTPLDFPVAVNSGRCCSSPDATSGASRSTARQTTTGGCRSPFARSRKRRSPEARSSAARLIDS